MKHIYSKSEVLAVARLVTDIIKFVPGGKVPYIRKDGSRGEFCSKDDSEKVETSIETYEYVDESTNLCPDFFKEFKGCDIITLRTHNSFIQLALNCDEYYPEEIIEMNKPFFMDSDPTDNELSGIHKIIEVLNLITLKRSNL